MERSKILELKNLTSGYGIIDVLKDVSIDVYENEVVTILGANGAGKTTTLNTIAGLLKPKKGKIIFNGIDITDIPAHKRVEYGVALVPEGRKIFSELTVMENLEMGAFTKDKFDVEAVFELFPVLKERKNQLGGTLSGGEQQMLAIGRALMSKPKLLLMDEPSLGLAPILVKKIFEKIKELNKNGVTLLLVEQNARMALKIADRAYILETGSIKMHGPANELINDRRIIEAYLGE